MSTFNGKWQFLKIYRQTLLPYSLIQRRRIKLQLCKSGWKGGQSPCCREPSVDLTDQKLYTQKAITGNRFVATEPCSGDMPQAWVLGLLVTIYSRTLQKCLFTHSTHTVSCILTGSSSTNRQNGQCKNCMGFLLVMNTTFEEGPVQTFQAFNAYFVTKALEVN